MRHSVVTRIATAVAASLALAACGSSPTADSGPDEAAPAKAASDRAVDTFERFNALSGAQRTDELVTCAEKEGALSIYTSSSEMEALVEEFTDLYDIDVSFYDGDSESVLQRILQEQRAKFYGNDIAETNAGELNIMHQEGLLSPYEGELREKIREEARAEGWTGTRFNTFVVGWNTDLVKPGQEPKSFEELADPKWNGKLSMEIGDVDWFTTLYLHFIDKGKSEQEALELFKAIAANSKMTKGHTVQGELLSAGRFAVTLSSYSHTIDKAADKGAPVAWKAASGEPVQPLVVRPNGIALMKTATNPCAALLFVDFELSGGQQVFEEGFRVGATPEAATVLDGLEVVPVPEDELLDNGKKWDDLYAEVTTPAGS